MIAVFAWRILKLTENLNILKNGCWEIAKSAAWTARHRLLLPRKVDKVYVYGEEDTRNETNYTTDTDPHGERDPHFIETLEGSFSSVSTPLIARVGAFLAFFELYKICIPSHRSKFRNFAKVCQHFCAIFCNISQILLIFKWLLKVWAVQRNANLVSLEKC